MDKVETVKLLEILNAAMKKLAAKIPCCHRADPCGLDDCERNVSHHWRIER